MTDHEEYKRWIRTTDSKSLVQQLEQEIKGPLEQAQNLVNMLWMMVNPSPKVQARIDSGELNHEQMLNEVGELIEQVYAVFDFYRNAFEE